MGTPLLTSPGLNVFSAIYGRVVVECLSSTTYEGAYPIGYAVWYGVIGSSIHFRVLRAGRGVRDAGREGNTDTVSCH